MRPFASSGHVRQIDPPPDTRALSGLPRIDYQDAFTSDRAPEDMRTAEQWARTVLESAPQPLRAVLPIGWAALGLRHRTAPRARSVLGWEITRSAPDLTLVHAESWFGMPGELIFQRRSDTWLLSTAVKHENRAMRTLWKGVIPFHVGIVRFLLETAAARTDPV